MNYVLAIDIGASSGRHILGWIENGRLQTKEVYRFENSMFRADDGHDHWDIESIFGHVIKGMQECARINCIPQSVAIDTWGVDYVLLDEAYMPVEAPFAYRDRRTDGMDRQFDKEMPFEELYRRTGIAKNSFNTLYQLLAEKKENLVKAKHLLFIPCYLNYLLSGVAVNEYSFASTSALLDMRTGDWEKTVLEKAHIDPALLGEKPVMPGTVLGKLNDNIAKRVGYHCTVIAPCTHDTGCAFMSVPGNENHVIISSGTWSLLGIVADKPETGRDAMLSGFTNEGGYGGSIRFLQNIMGLWMIQSVRKEWNKKYTFSEMASLAQNAQPVPVTIDVNNKRYLAPESMIEEIKKNVVENGYPESLSDGQIIAVVLKGLAVCYKKAIENMEKITHKHFTGINIIGGGCNNRVLNQWTSDITKLPVYAGPDEGTAIGNILCQLIETEKLSVSACEDLIGKSFNIEKFECS